MMAMEVGDHWPEENVGSPTFTAFVHPEIIQRSDSDDLALEIPLSVSRPNSPITDPFVLSFNNLTYQVKVGHKSRFPWSGKNLVVPTENDATAKILLNDISGDIREGEITAILGPSGAGKSTLMDALANRIDKRSLKGSVTMNGEVLQSGLFKVISAYVMQDDVLFPMLTVEETLMFAAEFRLPRSVSKEKKWERVQALIDQLGLRNAARTVIGDEGHRGVSGGERRRVSIGIDIIHDPILLFLDEPTSGLDSASAYMVVQVLKRIAQSGSVVIMTIHQPSSRIVGLLDRMIFLSRGQTLYNDSPANLLRFFDEFGHPVPENGNPCEFALDFIRELEESVSGTKDLVEFNQSWQVLLNSNNNVSKKPTLSLENAIMRSISQGKLVTGATSTSNQQNLKSAVPSFANSFWYEVLVLLKRLAINSRRMPGVFAFRFSTVVVTAVVVGTMFWKVDKSPRGVQEILGCLALAVSTIFFTSLTEAPEFVLERYIFMRETAYNAYRRSSYVLARSFIAIPPMIVISLCFSVIVFWSVGLSGGFSGFIFFSLTAFATFWAGSSLTALVSGMFPDIFLSYVMGSAFVSYFFFFCGFLISRTRLPKYWLWLHYTSVMKYPVEAFLQNEFRPSQCFAQGPQLFDNSALANLPRSTKDVLLASIGNILNRNFTDSTCITTGKDVLKIQGITQLNKWNCLLVTFAFAFSFRIMFYLTLLFGSKNKRK